MGEAAIYTWPITRTTERKDVLRHFPSFNKPTPLDLQIDAVLKKMQALGVDHEEYPKMVTLLERLEELKPKKQQLSRDTMAIVLGNFFGVLAVLAYERTHVITSKGFTQIIRPKVP